MIRRPPPGVLRRVLAALAGRRVPPPGGDAALDVPWDVAHPNDRLELREWVSAIAARNQAPWALIAVTRTLLDIADEYDARLASSASYGVWLTNPAAPVMDQCRVGQAVAHLAYPDLHPWPDGGPRAGERGEQR